MTHPLIVIEGCDGTGKETQAKLLMERLLARGVASLVDFPMYDTPTGRMVKRMITDPNHKPGDLPAHVAAWPFTLDRVAARPKLLAALARGPVVANRYVEANAGYQAAKLATTAERRMFVGELEEIEYDVFALPRPTRVILLDMPTEISRALLLERAKRTNRPLDEWEKNFAYQAQVGAVYRMLAAERDNWSRIECARAGSLRTSQTIAEEIWQQVLPLVEKTVNAAT